MPPHEPHHRLHRSLWGTVFFLLAFSVLIVLIAREYLIPALHAAGHATPGQRQHLSAYSWLLMALLLLILVFGLLLTFRVSRFFFPRATSDSARTKYDDAWTESARRVNHKDT